MAENVVSFGKCAYITRVNQNKSKVGKEPSVKRDQKIYYVCKTCILICRSFDIKTFVVAVWLIIIFCVDIYLVFRNRDLICINLRTNYY